MWKCPTAVRKPLVLAVASASALMVAAAPASAFDLNFGDESELSGTLDVTLGYATSYRAEDSDTNHDMYNNGFNFLSETRVPNKGDQVSAIYSLGLELGLAYRNYGLEVSGRYQYDSEIMDEDSVDYLGNPGPWSKAAENYAGDFAELNDAFVYGAFDIGENALEVRVGKQVINWGEGLYFLDGASAQSSLNINQLVTPGSELKDAYIGNTSVYANMSIGESTSVEAYVHADWNRSELPPQGTFYGYDILYRGGEEITPGTDVAFGLGGADMAFRGPDQEASDSGQWGVATRTTIGDVEYGLYYSRYHETLAFYEADPAGGILGTRQIWPEDIDMFGASFSTTVGDFALAGEVAYRPDRPLSNIFNGLAAFGGTGKGFEERDTINASVNAIWLGSATGLGIDSQVGIIQFGVDHISGDTSNLTVHSSVTHDGNNVATTLTPDSNAYGVAGQYIVTWQSLMPNTDVSLDLFVQHDISGYSHFYGNFAEGRTLSAVTVTASYGSAFEASLGYARTDHDESDYEDLDTVNFAMNYKF